MTTRCTYEVRRYGTYVTGGFDDWASAVGFTADIAEPYTAGQPIGAIRLRDVPAAPCCIVEVKNGKAQAAWVVVGK